MIRVLHAAVRAVHGTLLYRTAEEGRALWDQIVRRARVLGLMLMPNHVHSELPNEDELRLFREALRAYAMQRNRARGESGPVIEHHAKAQVVEGGDKVRRLRRYMALNPCRAGLVADPLAWPFSTHRDVLGLAFPAVCARVRDPAAFHAYVSGDPSVNPAGTPLPAGGARPDQRPATLPELVAAVGALTRNTPRMLRQDRTGRGLLILSAQHLGEIGAEELAAFLGVHANTVRRRRGPADARVRAVESVLGDRRFTALPEGDLRQLPSWRRYRHLR